VIFVVREVHDGHDKCELITFIKLKLTDDFPEQISSKMNFQIGYFIWKQSSKYWLMCQADLDTMYKALKRNRVCFFGVMGSLQRPSQVEKVLNHINVRAPALQHFKRHHCCAGT